MMIVTILTIGRCLVSMFDFTCLLTDESSITSCWLSTCTIVYEMRDYSLIMHNHLTRATVLPAAHIRGIYIYNIYIYIFFIFFILHIYIYYYYYNNDTQSWRYKIYSFAFSRVRLMFPCFDYHCSTCVYASLVLCLTNLWFAVTKLWSWCLCDSAIAIARARRCVRAIAEDAGDVHNLPI